MNTDLGLSLRDLSRTSGADQHQSKKDGNNLITQLLDVQDHYLLHNLKSLAWITNLQCLTTHDPLARKRKSHPDTTTSHDHLTATSTAPTTRTLARTTVNGRSGDYIAISYPWTADDDAGEEPSSGTTTIDSPATGSWRIRASSSFSSSAASSRTPTSVSAVRDAVLDRAWRCAEALGCARLWIDRECVPQEIDEDDEDESAAAVVEKEQALNTMDLVYQLSDWPVALLFRPIADEVDLRLFEKVMMRKLLKGGSGPGFKSDSGVGRAGDERLKDSVDAETARAALRILREVTDDPWWERAWTFQENYCAGPKMSLLIPLKDKRWWRKKRKYEFWRTGDVPGELMVSSVEFHKAATRFCLAYMKSAFISNEEKGTCRTVIRKAGRYSYTILYDGISSASDYSRTMTTRILEDIAHRNARFRADLLPIASNCCEYGVRLDTNRLSKSDISLAVCILALWLLNGEIYKSHVEKTPAELEAMNVFEYLKAISLDNFSPPLQRGQLTFLKTCRFVDVQLSEHGVTTSGWLWKLDHQISTDDLKFHSLDQSAPQNISQDEQKTPKSPLEALGIKLRHLKHHSLANLLESKSYFSDLEEQKNAVGEGTKSDSPAEIHLRTTAKNLERGIMKGYTLFLGRLWDAQNEDDQTADSHTAIFIGGREVRENDYSVPSTQSSWKHHSGGPCARRSCSGTPDLPPPTQESVLNFDTSIPAFAFTAWSGRSEDDDRNIEESQIDKYVSLEVEVDEERANGIPILQTKRWLNGLCFFSRAAETDVTFAWPPGLRNGTW